MNATITTQPTAYYRWNKDGAVAWYCQDHQNRLTNPFWANGDETFIAECCKCGAVMSHQSSSVAVSTNNPEEGQ